ncbi:MAG: hypothetical protein GY938_05060 [Ketobacter sp.]|nr:hypothetical protein [Ketobacter sp.]
MNQQIDPNVLMQQIMAQMMRQHQNMPELQAPPTAPQRTPEMMKKERIAQALAMAGNTMATTPGDFMSGLSAGVGAGAQDYAGSRKAQRDESRQAQKDYQAQETRRMAIMRSLLSGAGTMKSDRRADASAGRDAQRLKNQEENTRLNRERQTEQDRIAAEEKTYQRSRTTKQDRTNAEDRIRENLRTQSNDISAKQAAKHKGMIDVEKLVNSRAKSLGLDNPMLEDAQRSILNNQLDEYRNRLQRSAPSKAAKSKYKDGQTARNASGEVLVYRTGRGWVAE